jgi:hypothetical protein
MKIRDQKNKKENEQPGEFSRNDLHEKECLTFWHRSFFNFLAHPVYKM